MIFLPKNKIEKKIKQIKIMKTSMLTVITTLKKKTLFVCERKKKRKRKSLSK
jgi:hypothetical protein